MNAARFVVLALASAGFISYGPDRVIPFVKWKGGGLLASILAAGILWWAQPGTTSAWILAAATTVLSIPVCHWAEKFMGRHDDPRIVLDEVAGMFIAGAGWAGSWQTLLAALALFRVFDVLKGPWGRWAARMPGGWGVMADDVLAGLIANGILHVAVALNILRF
jgi:phosphatidylglycerophosphatase A